MHINEAIWCIAALATAGVIIRPFRLPEAVWALAGAFALVAFGLLPLTQAWNGVLNGTDVYMFLAGMMLLSELARKEGFFDWLAAVATTHAKGSPQRLFLLVYAVGTVVTIFLSNDATAVVLTPAVYAAARTARVSNPLPYLLICAFIANAASFVLPISNPANLVVFQDGLMPPLMSWLAVFAVPSIISILATYFLLHLTQRKALRIETLPKNVEAPGLSHSGAIAGAGILVTAIVLMVVSALGLNLGAATLCAGIACAALVTAVTRENPWRVLRDISWGVLPLVAGLFVLVEALERTGIIGAASSALRDAAALSPHLASAMSGTAVALASNLANNLPVGLFAGTAVRHAHVSHETASAILVGVDLGPNLSITGSLATILWLGALRREGQSVSAWQFLKIGTVVMLPTLALTLGALVLVTRL